MADQQVEHQGRPDVVEPGQDRVQRPGVVQQAVEALVPELVGEPIPDGRGDAAKLADATICISPHDRSEAVRLLDLDPGFQGVLCFTLVPISG